MNSRYNFMTEGNTFDEVSKSLYPDPLSLNYHNLALSETPSRETMTEDTIRYFWRECQNVYGSPELDDMVLTLNGVPHINFLKPGESIYFPNKSDLMNSFIKDR